MTASERWVDPQVAEDWDEVGRYRSRREFEAAVLEDQHDREAAETAF